MSALSDIVAKFRSGSPNIAKAFDEVERRLVALETPDPAPPPPPPPPVGLPFGEAQLRAGYRTLTIPVGVSRFTVPAGADALIDLAWVKRDRGLKISVQGGQRVHVKNVLIESSVGSLGAFDRGGLGFMPATSTPPDHCSVTGYRATGPVLTDGLTLGGNAGKMTLVTVQDFRVESASLFLGRQSTEPSEHCDAMQVQGQVDRIQLGHGTFYACDVAAPNHPGKGLMLNDYAATGYTVELDTVNFRMKGANTGAAIFQDARSVKVNLTDVWCSREGGSSYPWATGSPLFIAYGFSGQAWESTGTAPNRVASLTAGTGYAGIIREGSTDIVT